MVFLVLVIWGNSFFALKNKAKKNVLVNLVVFFSAIKSMLQRLLNSNHKQIISWFVPQELPEAKLLFFVYLCVNQAGTDLSIYRSLGINRVQLV